MKSWDEIFEDGRIAKDIYKDIEERIRHLTKDLDLKDEMLMKTSLENERLRVAHRDVVKTCTRLAEEIERMKERETTPKVSHDDLWKWSLAYHLASRRVSGMAQGSRLEDDMAKKFYEDIDAYLTWLDQLPETTTSPSNLQTVSTTHQSAESQGNLKGQCFRLCSSESVECVCSQTVSESPEAAEIKEIIELREDNWFIDNPNASEVNERIDILLKRIQELTAENERLNGPVEWYCETCGKEKPLLSNSDATDIKLRAYREVKDLEARLKLATDALDDIANALTTGRDEAGYMVHKEMSKTDMRFLANETLAKLKEK